MKKLYLIKFIGGYLLAAYAVIFWLYCLMGMAFVILVAVGKARCSGSDFEDGIRWFFNHPTAFIVCASLTIPGILFMIWTDVQKKRSEKETTYRGSYR